MKIEKIRATYESYLGKLPIAEGDKHGVLLWEEEFEKTDPNLFRRAVARLAILHAGEARFSLPRIIEIQKMIESIEDFERDERERIIDNIRQRKQAAQEYDAALAAAGGVAPTCEVCGREQAYSWKPSGGKGWWCPMCALKQWAIARPEREEE